MEAYVEARDKVFPISNIVGSRSGAGLVPFRPQKVVHQVLSLTPPPTPCSANNPSDNVFISSSPVDIPTLQAADAALKDAVARNDSIQIPLRNYINRLTTKLERFETRTVILERKRIMRERLYRPERKVCVWKAMNFEG